MVSQDLYTQGVEVNTVCGVDAAWLQLLTQPCSLISLALLALGILVAIYFSIYAKFFCKHISKINRDKCLKIWESKIYLAINAWTLGHEHATPTDVGTSAILAFFWR